MPLSDKQTAGLLFVLSGPSGVGKDAALNRIVSVDPTLVHVTTVTTRPRRANETGADYHFVSLEEYQRMLSAGEFLETANVYGNYYGVPKSAARQALREGKDVIVKVDVQGAASIKKLVPEAVYIFLEPASLEELRQRLEKRRTENPFDLELRLKTASSEMSARQAFDYTVVNAEGALEQAVANIRAIILAEKSRVHRRQINL